MSVNTILLDFSIDPLLLEGSAAVEVESGIVNSLENHFGKDSLTNVLSRAEISAEKNSGILSVYVGPRGSTVAIRIYSQVGLVTINVDYYKRAGDTLLLNYEECKELEKVWSAQAQMIKPVKTLPPIRRGLSLDVYFLSSDERILEYDIDKVVFDERSAFQHIQILHSINFGNLLVLDDYQNLAESDLVYTESIMRRGIENYADKDVLILGGGDGALLHELLKENPKMVVMIEIDDMVMQACKEHLRLACGDTLDNYKGTNYEIIVGDCVDYLSKCDVEGKKFDYVFGDLTDIPISLTPQGELWDFIKNILKLSFKILKDDGKYMTHGNGVSSQSALKMYEGVIEKLEPPVTFNRTEAFVPSFMENWVFYQIQKKMITFS